MMSKLELLKELTVKNSKKIILVVIDGLGGLEHPETGKTELESADISNINKLAAKSQCGLTVPISYGITPGSGPAHLSLFGYDPIQYQIGRGVLEALGIGLNMDKDALACRANYATVDYKKGIVTDRRAGRIATELNKQLCQLLQEKIKVIENTEVKISPGKEHRFVVIFRGKDLFESITDNDPQKDNYPPKNITAVDKKSEKTARIVNLFIEKVKNILSDKSPANYALLRGFSKYPDIPSMQEIYKLNPAAIATYPMYKGLAQLVGMKILQTDEKLSDEIETLKKEYNNYDFFYFHIKAPDKYGEDGNFEGKIKALEEIDKHIPDILSVNPDVLIITGDHATPALLKSHSWHNVPFLLYTPAYTAKGIDRFTEHQCLSGSLDIFPAIDVISLALANSFKLTKYGA